jgi:hypothetical protein
VLKHSIHRAIGAMGKVSGQYDYQMYAMYHPNAAACALLPLEQLGYTMLKRETPVPVSEIQGEFRKSRIESNGCCGEKEPIKLEAYTLTDHAIPVLVLKPPPTTRPGKTARRGLAMGE